MSTEGTKLRKSPSHVRSIQINFLTVTDFWGGSLMLT